MIAVGPTLLIFATNGVWQISGSQESSFRANDYVVSKVSTASITAPKSIVVVNGHPFWWDKSGIYTIQTDQIGNSQAISISVDTIQSVIQSIPDTNIKYIKGAYDDIRHEIHWIYRSVQGLTRLQNYQYDRIMIFNTVTASFSLHSLPNDVPMVSGLIFTSKANSDSLIGIPGASLIKYIITGSIGTSNVRAFSIAQLNDSTYTDWRTLHGNLYQFDSYCITGPRIRGNLLKKQQSNYIAVILDQEVPGGGSCFIQGLWDYASLSGRYTTKQQVYRANSDSNYSRRKVKMRGNGYSLQLKFSSEKGKPFALNGWASFDTGGNIP